MILAGLVVAAATVGASAQSLSGLSSSCQSAGTNLLLGPAGTCLGASGLINIATTPSNESLVTPVDKWLTSMCAQPACTNATINAAISNITTGCSSDLALTTAEAQQFAQDFENWYPVGRQVACLKDSNASDAFCVTSTLKALETYLGAPLSLNSISNISIALAGSGSTNPQSLVCTACIEASYALIRPHLADSDRSTVDGYLGVLCGSSYSNGTFPASIKQSANTANSGGSSNGALSSFSVWGSATTFLMGVAGVVALVL